MKVREFIEQLQTLSPDADIVIQPTDFTGVLEIAREPAVIVYDSDSAFSNGVVELTTKGRGNNEPTSPT